MRPSAHTEINRPWRSPRKPFWRTINRRTSSEFGRHSRFSGSPAFRRSRHAGLQCQLRLYQRRWLPGGWQHRRRHSVSPSTSSWAYFLRRSGGIWTGPLRWEQHMKHTHSVIPLRRRGGYCFAIVGRSVSRYVRPSVRRLTKWFPTIILKTNQSQSFHYSHIWFWWGQDPYWFWVH